MNQGNCSLCQKFRPLKQVDGWNLCDECQKKDRGRPGTCVGCKLQTTVFHDLGICSACLKQDRCRNCGWPLKDWEGMGKQCTNPYGACKTKKFTISGIGD